MSNRIFEVDVFRGLAILLMIVFHFTFDLHHFQYIELDITKNLYWNYFRLFIVTLFLLIVGISLYLSYEKEIDLSKLKTRIITLSLASALVTIGTIFTFENSWIYFGILHFILVASIVGVVFVKIPKISLIIGITIIIAYHFDYLHLYFLFDFFKPIFNLPMQTEDLVRFFPWFGVVLIGIYLGYKRLFFIEIIQNRLTSILAIMGEFSLFIYLTHQILLFGIFYAIDYLK